jgi:hypothetical protein
MAGHDASIKEMAAASRKPRQSAKLSRYLRRDRHCLSSLAGLQPGNWHGGCGIRRPDFEGPREVMQTSIRGQGRDQKITATQQENPGVMGEKQ